jgi:hypothetical protein
MHFVALYCIRNRRTNAFFVSDLRNPKIVMMDRQWKQLDTPALKALYEVEFKALSDALLNGAAWKDVQDKRKRLITLTKLLYDKSLNNPAEFPGRKQS